MRPATMFNKRKMVEGSESKDKARSLGCLLGSLGAHITDRGLGLRLVDRRVGMRFRALNYDKQSCSISLVNLRNVANLVKGRVPVEIKQARTAQHLDNSRSFTDNLPVRSQGMSPVGRCLRSIHPNHHIWHSSTFLISQCCAVDKQLKLDPISTHRRKSCPVPTCLPFES